MSLCFVQTRSRRAFVTLASTLVLVTFLTWKAFSPVTNDSKGPESSTPEIDWLMSEPFPTNLVNNTSEMLVPVSYAVHAFYYAWYNAPIPGQPPSKSRHWLHWNHRRLPYYIRRHAAQYPSGAHRPPDDIGANFYPKLGPYASSDPEIIRAHFRMARFAGIGVLVLSWYPAGMGDDNGEPVDDLVLPLLDAAAEHGLKLCLHIEPYRGRTAQTVAADFKYALDRQYTTHPAYYQLSTAREDSSTQPLPVFFVYDSYTVDRDAWTSILTKSGKNSIRGRPEDAYVVGLMTEATDCEAFGSMGFDAGYTYFAGRATTYSSLPHTWLSQSEQCRCARVHFYPSIGPGYDDLAVRPYNTKSTVIRDHGQRYRERILKAIESKPDGLGITSFNEWGEGSQIESAKPYNRPVSMFVSRPYSDYILYSSDFYLRLTRMFVNQYANFSLFPRGYFLMREDEANRVKTLSIL